ncbi:MAG: type II secretion system F family protein [Candidatus Omnitrophica bacterium]|jgi:pilus assembly protein TadC|nr:type II secretion system F family protein [Candidatus Omnitrophota bacterium]
MIMALIAAAIFLITYNILQARQEPRLKLSDAFPKQNNFRLINFKKSRFYGGLLKGSLPVIKPLLNLPYFVNLQVETEVLRLKIDLNGFMLVKLVVMILVLAGAFYLLSPAYALISGLLGFFLPDLFIWSKVRKKKEAIVRVFPETIDLLDMCVNAGADFLSAIKWIVEISSPNPFVEQLSIVLGEIQVGKTRSQALKDMANRLKLVDISSFVRAIIQSERMGTSIEEAFRNLSEDTRDKRFQSGERYAIKASLKILFPLIFCILPAILIVVAGPIIIKFSTGGLIP